MFEINKLLPHKDRNCIQVVLVHFISSTVVHTFVGFPSSEEVRASSRASFFIGDEASDDSEECFASETLTPQPTLVSMGTQTEVPVEARPDTPDENIATHSLQQCMEMMNSQVVCHG